VHVLYREDQLARIKHNLRATRPLWSHIWTGAHRCHICTGTALIAATSAPGPGSPLPHLTGLGPFASPHFDAACTCAAYILHARDRICSSAANGRLVAARIQRRRAAM
jgi:hypothetical protein